MHLHHRLAIADGIVEPLPGFYRVEQTLDNKINVKAIPPK